ncbi:MAG: hypothetical protein WCE30_08250 [Mycobacterium sp.]
MTLTPGKLWAVYVGTGVLLAGGVVVGVLTHRQDAPSASPAAPPSAPVKVSAPAAPALVYPQQQNPDGGQKSLVCTSLTAMDADNVSRQFVIAVGNAYTATPQARLCQAATVVAHSEIMNQDYSMACALFESSQIKCTGGLLAVIVFRPSA